MNAKQAVMTHALDVLQHWQEAEEDDEDDGSQTIITPFNSVVGGNA
jgi:hypothetical protein